jgi:RNA polymerase sigma factor (sigma-70 family)
VTTTRTTAAEAAATASAPQESVDLRGRPGNGAAAARTEELYGRYVRTVSGLCGALLRDRAEAEDATQQTFLSAHRALLNGTDPREPAAWLATIARNECWARIRGRMRRPLPSSELETASDRHDPLAEAIRGADLAALWRAIEGLPRPQRDALLLREFGGLSYDELAEALAVSAPAVESLLFRARQRLRVQLGAAYASLSGASWLESLLRLLGGAPVAAKLAALGLGAATVTGSAVVVPRIVEQSRHPLPPAHTRQPSRHIREGRNDATTTPPVATPPPVSQLVLAPQRSDRSDAREAAGPERRDGGGRGDGEGGSTTTPIEHEGRGGSSGGGGEEVPVTLQGATVQTPTVQTPTGQAEVEMTTTEGSDGGSGGSDGGSGGSDGGSSGSDGPG